MDLWWGLLHTSCDVDGADRGEVRFQHARRGASLAAGSDFMRGLLGAVYAMNRIRDDPRFGELVQKLGLS